MGLPPNEFDMAFEKGLSFDAEQYEDDMAKKVVYITLLTGWSLEYVMDMDYGQFSSYYSVATDLIKEMNSTDSLGEKGGVRTMSEELM